jgi:LmbE family N-acetylglucosaminyl deacetylase
MDRHSQRKSACASLAAVLVAVFACVPGCARHPGSEPHGRIALSDTDRVLILAPHPDDEVLGCGGIIQAALAAHVPVKICFLTLGDSNEWSFVVYRRRPLVAGRGAEAMGEVRRREALAAARVLGVPADSLVFLGYPDFATFRIFARHWGSEPPARSLLTRAEAVPYPDAFRPGAPHKGEEILRDLESIISEFRPTKVYVSHAADHNVDHQAMYLFTRVALWELAPHMAPQVFPYLVHYPKWPTPRGDHPEKPLVPPRALTRGPKWMEFPLTPEETRRKREALDAHKSQVEVGRYLVSFLRGNELFGDYDDIQIAPSSEQPSTSSEEIPDEERNEQLTAEEQAAFVGHEERRIRIDGGDLELTIRYSRRLSRETAAEVYVFGYRYGTDFATMPKLRIKLGPTGYTVHDQQRKVSKNLIRVDRHFRSVIVRVPISALGSPDKVLTGGRTYVGLVPLDSMPWRVIDLTTRDMADHDGMTQ